MGKRAVAAMLRMVKCAADAVGDAVQLLAPFDPVVWDRARFERFWNWRYRFEACTPSSKRNLGYYALPLLWHGNVIGWANITLRRSVLAPSIG